MMDITKKCVDNVHKEVLPNNSLESHLMHNNSTSHENIEIVTNAYHLKTT